MSALSTTLDLFSLAPTAPMFRSSEISMVHSAPVRVRDDPKSGTSVRDRVLRFLDKLHPVGMAKRVCADTMRATRGAGIPANTIGQWRKRECDPSAGHLVTLGRTYGIAFVAAVFIEVDDLEAMTRARELEALEARVAALRARGVR